MVNLAFQSHDPLEIEEFGARRHQLIFENWERDKGLIPAQNLIELRHEDITARPMEIVEQIYRQFGLTTWPNMQPRLKAYTDTLIGYKNNEYRFDSEYVERLNPYLKAFAERHGYSIPGAM